MGYKERKCFFLAFSGTQNSFRVAAGNVSSVSLSVKLSLILFKAFEYFSFVPVWRYKMCSKLQMCLGSIGWGCQQRYKDTQAGCH